MKKSLPRLTFSPTLPQESIEEPPKAKKVSRKKRLSLLEKIMTTSNESRSGYLIRPYLFTLKSSTGEIQTQFSFE